MAAEQGSTVAGEAPPGAVSLVTLWFRLGSRGFELNHLEDGHSIAEKPTPKSPSQKSTWGNSEWVSEHAWLDFGKSPKILHNDANMLARLLATKRALQTRPA